MENIRENLNKKIRDCIIKNDNIQNCYYYLILYKICYNK